uniref:Uncharacterized protein n=1 Tax=Rhizophora mucronata TaxID=61149 RepID=A0A2P2NIC5_RHIMU
MFTYLYMLMFASLINRVIVISEFGFA